MFEESGRVTWGRVGIGFARDGRGLWHDGGRKWMKEERRQGEGKERIVKSDCVTRGGRIRRRERKESG